MSDFQPILGQQLCDQIADGQYSTTFVIERSYADWDLPLAAAAAKELRCDVVAVTKPESEMDDRGSVVYRQAFDVVLRKKFEQADGDNDNGERIAIEEVDALVKVLFEINKNLIPVRMSGGLDAIWDSTDIATSCIKKHLRECRQYTGVVRVMFSVKEKL